ncbi:hypothetical protein V6N12_003808 [Hibiscus sabdariffa]|uniref:RNase H type-1 domain-containing protein n=1 Tax=Hibiscus sabdariffa TaxID=183260 RepID=A0ABR2CJL0_9ROSI
MSGALHDIIIEGNRMVEDCRRAFGVHAAPCHTRTVEDCWKRTPSDWIKVNVDVAVSQVNNSEGIGAVIRDCDGGWLLGSVRFVGRCNVLFAELWTIHNSLAQAWIHGYHHVKLELDILEAVRIVTSSTAILQMGWSQRSSSGSIKIGKCGCDMLTERIMW